MASNRGEMAREIAVDLLVIAGLGMVFAGLMAQFGWPVACMLCGAILLGIGLIAAWRAQ